jgi:hypothetical protein
MVCQRILMGAFRQSGTGSIIEQGIHDRIQITEIAL